MSDTLNVAGIKAHLLFLLPPGLQRFYMSKPLLGGPSATAGTPQPTAESLGHTAQTGSVLVMLVAVAEVNIKNKAEAAMFSPSLSCNHATFHPACCTSFQEN